MKALSEVDAAYVAGIIDGEGTITLTRMHRGENRRLVVSISSTELVLLRLTPRNGRYTAQQQAARREFENRFFAISTRAGTTRRVAH
jgi:hypothetical protein